MQKDETFVKLRHIWLNYSVLLLIHLIIETDSYELKQYRFERVCFQIDM